MEDKIKKITQTGTEIEKNEEIQNILDEVRQQTGIQSKEETEEEMIDISAVASSIPVKTDDNKETDKSEVSEPNVRTPINLPNEEDTVNLESSEKEEKDKKYGGSTFVKIFCGFVASLVIIGGAFFCMYKFNPKVIPVSASVNIPGGKVKAPEEKTVFLKGIQIEGYDVGGKTIEETKSLLAVRGTTLLPEIDFTINYEGVDYKYGRDDLDFSYDLNSVVERAYEYNNQVIKSGSKDIITYAPGDSNVKVDTENGTVNFCVDYKVTQASVQKVVKRIAKKVDIPCVEPHVSKFDTTQSKNSKRYTFKEGSDGKAIDQDVLITQAMELFNKGETNVSLTAKSYESKPLLKMSDVKEATKLIGKFSTISTNSYNANSNMATALEAVNGTILEPGDTFSFNECTGNSNLTSNGYLPAGVISQGAMTTGIGGGICQAATTIYNAAIMANMEIVEREPHLWCSYYVYGGLDATIDWGSIDLKLKNNSKYQMFFRCWMDGVQLNVEIYGWQSPEFDEVRTETELDWSTYDSYGYNAYRVFYKNGKKIKKEELPYSVYSLSNGGGIRGADYGNVSTKLTQPE